MKSVKVLTGKLGLAALLGIGSPFVIAADDSGWYVGGNIGQSRATIDEKKITNNLSNAGFTTTSISVDEKELGYKLFGGYQFNQYIALEGGYFDLGKFGFEANTLPLGTLEGSVKAEGPYLDLVGILPISERFSGLARVGAHYAYTDGSFVGTGAVTTPSSNPDKWSGNYKFGLGLQYSLTQSLGVRLEAERYRIDDTVDSKGDIDLYSLGLVYRFGKDAPADEPVAVSEAPASAYIAPVAPVAAPVTKVEFHATSLYSFDSAALTDKGKKSLDDFIAKLANSDFETITVTGYTDRIGSYEYNLKLSRERAQVVKDYMVKSAGIPVNNIVVEGKASANPMTKPGKCKGTKVTPELITCLYPDRRVEVSVSGTK